MLKYLTMIAVGIALLIGGISLGVFDGGSGAGDQPGDGATVQMPELSAVGLRGSDLYDKNCAQCHGINAVGTDKGPPFLHRVYHPNHHADAAFFFAVRRGVRRHHWSFGDMPSQPHIGDNDISAIITYIRALQHANGFAP